MNLPNDVLKKIEEISSENTQKNLSQNFRKISDKYLGEKTGKSLLTNKDEVIAYAISRMPATYCAVWKAFHLSLEIIKNEKFKSLIDVGAGTGSASLAISNQVNLDKIICFEREAEMINLGKELLSTDVVLSHANWENVDILQNVTSNVADIVVASYILNEFSEDMLFVALEKLWNMTGKLLLIVEPGTPKDYKRMMLIKRFLLKKGANIVAPCTSASECKIKDDDWCNFSCRVERTKLQKSVKNAEVPYEDEKFTFLAFSRAKYENQVSRIIRTPIIKTNLVKLKLCENGEIIERDITKSEKDLYKIARKLNNGDIL